MRPFRHLLIGVRAALSWGADAESSVASILGGITESLTSCMAMVSSF